MGSRPHCDAPLALEAKITTARDTRVGRVHGPIDLQNKLCMQHAALNDTFRQCTSQRSQPRHSPNFVT